MLFSFPLERIDLKKLNNQLPFMQNEPIASQALFLLQLLGVVVLLLYYQSAPTSFSSFFFENHLTHDGICLYYYSIPYSIYSRTNVVSSLFQYQYILVFKTKRSIMVQYYIIDSIPDALALAPARVQQQHPRANPDFIYHSDAPYSSIALDKKLVVLFPRICVLLEGFPSGSTAAVLHRGREPSCRSGYRQRMGPLNCSFEIHGKAWMGMVVPRLLRELCSVSRAATAAALLASKPRLFLLLLLLLCAKAWKRQKKKVLIAWDTKIFPSFLPAQIA